MMKKRVLVQRTAILGAAMVLGPFSLPAQSPTGLYVGNESAQSGATNPTVTNATPRFSAVHQHPGGLSAIGYSLQVATNAAFASLLWDNPASTNVARPWSRLWGTNSSQYGQAVTVDNAGSVYVAGRASNSFDGQTNAGLADLVLTKYSPAGVKQWTRLWGSSSSEYGQGVAADSSGNVYVAGYTFGSFDGQSNAGSYDLVLTKFAGDGTKQWSRLWGSSNADYGRAVAVDAAGNIYVAGHTMGAFDGQTNAGFNDLVLTKYAGDGTKQWTRLWGSSTHDYGYGVAVDVQTNIYVTGSVAGALDSQTAIGFDDLVLTKFSSNGIKQWTRVWGSTTFDYGYAVVADQTTNIYVAGETWGAFDGQMFAGSHDMVLTKYTSDGTKQWTRLWGSSSWDYGQGVDVDKDGHIYVGGYTRGAFDGQTNAGWEDVVLSKFNPAGTRLWSRLWGGTGLDYGYAVAVDAGDNIYVAGYTDGTFDGQTNAGSYDLFLSKWSQGGMVSFGTTVVAGARSPDITYAGAALSTNVTNYWRIRFFDTTTNACAWSKAGDNWFIRSNYLDPAGDEDGDGMPNGWEQQYGLNPLNPSDATGDPDGDGVNNLTEYYQGRDPTKGAVADTSGLVNLNVYTPLE